MALKREQVEKWIHPDVHASLAATRADVLTLFDEHKKALEQAATELDDVHRTLLEVMAERDALAARVMELEQAKPA